MSMESMPPETEPSEDIAKWLAKIDRVELAMEEQVVVNGAEDGQTAWLLVDPNPAKQIARYWLDPDLREEAYETVILYELEGALSLQGLTRALDLPVTEPIDPIKVPADEHRPSGTALNERARRLSDQALLAGLGRLGMVETAEDGTRTAPNSAVAALMYRRADIRQESDRRLHERADEIDSMRKQIAQAAHPRMLGFAFATGREVMSVYRGLAFEGVPALNDSIDLEAPTKLGKWWEELGKDFKRIEAVDLNLSQGM